MERKRGGGTNTGRGDLSGGRGGRGGCGGGGRGMGAMDPITFNNADYVRDPHECTPMPETEWTLEMREIYKEIISKLDEKVEEDMIEGLTPRQGDIILIQLLFMKVTAHQNRAGGKDDLTINKNLRSSIIGTSPASPLDLYTQAGRQSVYEQASDEDEKKDRIITNMLTPFLMRNYTNTKKLLEVIEGLYNNAVGEVRKLAMDRNAMMRYMYIEGGLATRYVPIQVSDQLPTPITNDNEEDDNFDYGIDGEDWNTQGINGEDQEEDDVEETKVDNSHIITSRILKIHPVPIQSRAILNTCTMDTQSCVARH
eukprot:scaffold9202_cov42-Cyclotella_meneghiniana.AAC.1